MTSAKSMATLLALVFWSASVLSPDVHARTVSQAGSSVPTQLSEDTLRLMLEGMGYEPKALSKGFLLTIKRDDWTVSIQIVLSDNKEKLGMNANLGTVKDPDSVTGAQWRALVAANRDLDPSFFYFDADKKKLYLHRAMNNRGLTPAYMRTQIEAFIDNLKSTLNLWKFTE